MTAITILTPLSQYISYGEINIEKNEWIRLNEEFGKEAIINFFVEEILAKNIFLPMRSLTVEDATESFVKLCEYVPSDYEFAEVFTRYDYEYSLSGKFISESNVGNVASDYFQQYNRFCCDSANAPSPIRTWNNEKFLRGAISALWSLKCQYVNTSTLRTCLALRKYIASQFKPSVAKFIYTKYQSKDVLDFSAGWGDRLCGFYATENTRSYIGIDPNKAVCQKYDEQVALYEKLNGHKNVTIYNMAAEDVVLEPNIVDTVFTSPPYFNIEKYVHDENQSFKRYKKIDEWLTGFLYPTLTMSWKALKPNGHLIINISDVYSNHRINKICDPMNDFLTNLGGEFVEGVGMKMAKRPNSGALKNKTGVFVEPIWIWRKV